MDYDYSEAEIKLFNGLGADQRVLKYLNPSQLYSSLVMDVFIKNKTGKYVDALRAAMTRNENLDKIILAHIS